MKSIFRVFALVVMFVYPFSGSCQTIDSLIVGTGGGFSGQMIVYKFIKNTIYKGKGSVSIVYYESGVANSRVVKQIYRSAKKIVNKKTEFDHSSNVYYFIELHAKGKKIRCVWGDPSYSPPEDVLALYNQSMNAIKETKFYVK